MNEMLQRKVELTPAGEVKVGVPVSTTRLSVTLPALWRSMEMVAPLILALTSLAESVNVPLAVTEAVPAVAAQVSWVAAATQQPSAVQRAPAHHAISPTLTRGFSWHDWLRAGETARRLVRDAAASAD
jgi:hypothetical protein